MTSSDLRPPAELTWEQCSALLDRLPGLPLAERAPAIETLLRNPSPGIRGRALRVAAAVLPDETLVSYLRDGADAVRRNAGLEILRLRGARSYPLAVELLGDDDPDVVLQAVTLLEHLKDPRAFEPLRRVLAHPDPNVAQAAILAVGELGDARAIAELLPFLERDNWLRMAAVQALGDLRAPAAAAPLDALLTDLLLGPLAAEALARIGGPAAFGSLARHWLRFLDDLDPETTLGLLAHVAEGLDGHPPAVEGLRASLAERLRDPYRAVRIAAARCLVALGPGPEDAEALTLLAGSEPGPLLPSCLGRRADLAPWLLEQSGQLREWGFHLAARYPEAATAADLAAALRRPPPPANLRPVMAALEKTAAPELAEPLVEFWSALPAGERSLLHPLLERHRGEILGGLGERRGLSAGDRVVLAALLGAPPAEVAARLRELPAAERGPAIAQLENHPELVRDLPWAEWLERDPETWAELAAEVACAANLRELLPALRRRLDTAPAPALVRAVGELGDRESVPRLLALLDAEQAPEPALVLDSLGKIGGPEVRSRLRQLAAHDDAKVARMAYRALAACASEEDDGLFRQAAAHPDWLVRLASVDVLGRFARAENRSALMTLAADPVAIVARRAVARLEG